MGMLSVSPPWVPCKAPCGGGIVLPEGRLAISWRFLLFKSFLLIIPLSWGWQLLAPKPRQRWGIGLLLAPHCALAGHGGGFLSRCPQLPDSLCWALWGSDG